MPGMIDLTGFTLSGGEGILCIGLTNDNYALNDEVICEIQKEARARGVNLSADTDEGLFTLEKSENAENARGINILAFFIMKILRESGYKVAA